MEGGDSNRQILGKAGEDLACRYLEGKGHRILERNYRSGHLEIDIITVDADGIHFVEVKARQKSIQAPPQDNVGAAKQKKIVKAFLCSNCAADVHWASVQADKMWDNSYADYVKKAFEHKPTESLALTVIHHMPMDYVRALESKLVMFSRSEYCIRLADQADDLINKYDLNIFEILYVKARTGGKVNLTEQQVGYRFFRFIYTFCQKVLLGVYHCDDSIMAIPWIRRVLWALGELGYRNVLLQFLQMNRFVLSKRTDEKGKGEFHYAQLWMIDHYFPYASMVEDIDFPKVREAVEAYIAPRKIKLDAMEDLDKYDDLPPDVIDTITDFI